MKNNVVILRTPSGISGDMLVTGLARLGGLNEASLNEIIEKIDIPSLMGTLKIKEEKQEGIAGWKMSVNLPKEHHHRTLNDIRLIVENSNMTSRSKSIALDAFGRLGEAEGQVHMIAPEKVTFHEVGALDSILDICMASSLYVDLAINDFYCSPLPVCDGTVICEHGSLSTPAPAVLSLLKGVPVYGLDSTGETVTPTAIALLKAFGTMFGPWPNVVVENTIRVYGGRKLPNVPNGAIFVMGYSNSDDSYTESNSEIMVGS